MTWFCFGFGFVPSHAWLDPRPCTVGRTQDSRLGGYLINGSRDLRPETRDLKPETWDPTHKWKSGPKTRDLRSWKWIFSKFSQFSLKHGVYEQIHVLYAFMSILYVSHYPIIKHIQF